MFCPKCGQQIPDNSFFCPVCGASTQGETANAQGGAVYNAPANNNGFALKLRQMLSSNLFLVLCIIVSSSLVLSFASGFNLILVLFTVSLWISYANAKSSESVMSTSGIRFSAGIITFMWVLIWVVIGILGFFLITMVALLPTMVSELKNVDSAMLDEIMAGIEVELSMFSGYDEFVFPAVIEFLVNNMVAVFTVGSIVVAVIVGIYVLFNIFCYGKIRRFARGIDIAYNTNNAKELRFKTARRALIALGIFSAISFLANLGTVSYTLTTVLADAVEFSYASLISMALTTASFFVGSAWIKELENSVNDEDVLNGVEN